MASRPLPSDAKLDAAVEEMERDDFRGAHGITRLRRLIPILDAGDEEDAAADARLRLAELMAETGTRKKEDVVAAFHDAFQAASKIDGDTDAAYWGWIGYLAQEDDLDGALSLVTTLAADHPALDPTWTLVGIVHGARTDGRLEDAINAAERIAPVLVEGGWTSAAADARAEQAQALASLQRSDEAIQVCESAWQAGCASIALANRHSLLLERAKRFREAVEVCDRGIALGEKGDQIAKRRARCLAKLS